MARSLAQERQAVADEEQRLGDRRRCLAEKERDAAIEALERAGLLRLDHDRLLALIRRMDKLGVEECERRLP